MMEDLFLTNLLRRPPILLIAVLLFFYIVHKKIASKPSRTLTRLPILNSRPSDWFPHLQSLYRNTLDLKSALELHHNEQKNATVRVPILGPGKMVLLPAAEAKWLIEQPEHILSMHQQTDLHFQVEHGTVFQTRDQSHVHLVATKLTARIGNLVPELVNELEAALKQHWGRDREWKDVCVYDSLRVVIGQVTNRVFLGLPLCRNRELLDAGVAYAQAIPVAAQILTLFPRVLRPLVAPLITRPNRRHENTWFRLTVSEVERRLKEWEMTDGEGLSKNDDFLQWLIDHAKQTGDPYMWDPKILAARVFLINAAAVHTSSFAITHVLLDLIGAGPVRGPEYIAALRHEIRTVLAAHDGEWNKRALAQMEKLDSTFRESQRLNTVLTVGPLRIVNAEDGVTTPSGVHLPKGFQVGIPAYSIHFDKDVWGEDAAEFKPFRFVEMEKKQAWATTSTRYLAFGAGKNSCPGRFFAAAELKVMLGYILLNYDFEFQQERVDNQWFGTNHLPSTTATIRIKKRDAEA